MAVLGWGLALTNWPPGGGRCFEGANLLWAAHYEWLELWVEGVVGG